MTLKTFLVVFRKHIFRLIKTKRAKRQTNCECLTKIPVQLHFTPRLFNRIHSRTIPVDFNEGNTSQTSLSTEDDYIGFFLPTDGGYNTCDVRAPQ